MGHAIVALQLRGNTLVAVGYAKEGIINQRICEKALHKLECSVRGEKVSRSRSCKILPIMLFAVVIAGFIAVRGCIMDRTEWPTPAESTAETLSAEEIAFEAEVQRTIAATKDYNKAVVKFNQSVAVYNLAVTITCIDNLDGLPTSLEFLKAESIAYEDITEAVRSGIRIESIRPQPVYRLRGNCHQLSGSQQICSFPVYLATIFQRVNLCHARFHARDYTQLYLFVNANQAHSSFPELFKNKSRIR